MSELKGLLGRGMRIGVMMYYIYSVGVNLLRTPGWARLSLTQTAPRSSVTSGYTSPTTTPQESLQLVPTRKQSTEPAQKTDGELKPRPYSPFQVSTSNKAEFALARVDDLVNWARKVSFPFKPNQRKDDLVI